MILSGQSPDGRLVEIVELRDHPWFVASQFHPEFKSRPDRPHPLFDGFVAAAVALADDGSARAVPCVPGPAGRRRRRPRSTAPPPRERRRSPVSEASAPGRPPGRAAYTARAPVSALCPTRPGGPPMKLFLDTADIDEIRTAVRWGVIDGVTTNPDPVREGRRLVREVLRGDLHAHLRPRVRRGHRRGRGRDAARGPRLRRDRAQHRGQGRHDGERPGGDRRFAEEGIKTNCTLIFRPTRGCSPPRPGRRCCRPSWAAWTTSTRTA